VCVAKWGKAQRCARLVWQSKDWADLFSIKERKLLIISDYGYVQNPLRYRIFLHIKLKFILYPLITMTMTIYQVDKNVISKHV